MEESRVRRRTRSIDDIYAQLGRIGAMGNARTGNNFYQTARGKNARNIANRYISNIANSRGVTTTRNGVTFVDNTRRVSRATYMGLNNG